jgi:ABC-type uncharacterized transport system permease subunit
MTTFLLAVFSICAYLGSALFIVRYFSRSSIQPVTLYFAWAAVIGHGLYIVLKFIENNGYSFSFFSSSSLVAWIVALLLLVATLNKPVENLGLVVFPIAALMLVLELIFNDNSPVFHAHNWQMSTHILSSIIAFSLINIAAIQAILLAIQDQQLKSHPPRRFIRSLPPLQTMEALLFQMIATGVFFLTISLLTGFIFVSNLFAQHLIHKTVLSMLAWIIFSCLLLGRSRYGWRGSITIRWTLAGFVSLLLAYFGSKLVLELILHR